MLTILSEFGDITLKAETGQDKVWLTKYLENTAVDDMDIKNNYLEIDMESSCRIEKDEEALGVSLEQVLDEKGNVWGGIEKITICAFKI